MGNGTRRLLMQFTYIYSYSAGKYSFIEQSKEVLSSFSGHSLSSLISFFILNAPSIAYFHYLKFAMSLFTIYHYSAFTVEDITTLTRGRILQKLLDLVVKRSLSGLVKAQFSCRKC
jgi:hypothetical protein